MRVAKPSVHLMRIFREDRQLPGLHGVDVVIWQPRAFVFEHAENDGVARAFEPERMMPLERKAEPLHLTERATIVRLDFGREPLRLREQRHEDRP